MAQVIPFNDTYLIWNSNTSTFVIEASEMAHAYGIKFMDRQLSVKHEGKNITIDFQFAGMDKTPDGEIAGWKYKAVAGHSKPCSLLIIND